MVAFLKFMRFMANWEAWGVISFFLTIFPSLAILWYIWPRKKMHPNIYINAIADDSPDKTYSRVVRITINNMSNNVLYVESLGFKFGDTISPNPLAAKDHNSGIYEIKFETGNRGAPMVIDTLVRANHATATWIPVNNGIDKNVLANAVSQKKVGTLRLKYMFISDKPSKKVKFDIKI
ncbi:MAG: hypothetical protein ABSE00_07645 [Chitinispirillaceae bacterium]|jgi:hypothetical protein